MLQPRDWADEAPAELRVTLDRTWTKQFPLRTRGRYIINRQGHRFRLKAINWYGASDASHVVGGLDVQTLDRICATVVDLGFNTVRLPFSNEMLRSAVPERAISFEKNPELKGLSALQVFDEVVRALGRHRIAVILNNHTTYGEFCGPPSKNSLWFDPGGLFSEEDWMCDWIMMAKRYAAFPHVCGYDLRNEIRPRLGLTPFFRGGGQSACYGSGSKSKATPVPAVQVEPSGRCNWARAARTLAFQLLDVQAAQLIIVERIVWPQGPIVDYAARPGPLLPALDGHLVLGVHMYHWSGPGRFVPPWAIPPRLSCLFGVVAACGIVSKHTYGTMGDNLAKQVDREWGDVLKANVCPVWVSEFGADARCPEEMFWMRDFVRILGELNVDWAYWPLNVGPKSGTGTGDVLTDGEEYYGMLNPDWTPRLVGEDPRLVLLERLGLVPKERQGLDLPARRESLNDDELLGPTMRFGRRASKPLNSKIPFLGMTSKPDLTVLVAMMKSGEHGPGRTGGLGLGIRRIESAGPLLSLMQREERPRGVSLSATSPCLRAMDTPDNEDECIESPFLLQERKNRLPSGGGERREAI